MSSVPSRHDDNGRPSWIIRRTVVICTLVFCAGVILYLTGWGKDDELRATIASGLLFLAGTVITGYVFGVVWNDTSSMKHQRANELGREMPYEEGVVPFGTPGGLG